MQPDEAEVARARVYVPLMHNLRAVLRGESVPHRDAARAWDGQAAIAAFQQDSQLVLDVHTLAVSAEPQEGVAIDDPAFFTRAQHDAWVGLLMPLALRGTTTLLAIVDLVVRAAQPAETAPPVEAGLVAAQNPAAQGYGAMTASAAQRVAETRARYPPPPQPPSSPR